MTKICLILEKFLKTFENIEKFLEIIIISVIIIIIIININNNNNNNNRNNIIIICFACFKISAFTDQFPLVKKK